MFVRNKRFISIVLAISAVLLLFSLSAVSAATYDMDDSNTTSDIQNVIDTDVDDDLEIRLADGSYTFSQIDVKRNATIIGQSKGGVVISGTGTLFNITSVNVRIINLTIIGFDTGIQSNSGGLTIVDNNITTNGISINISSDGADLKGIKIENNTIDSLVDYWDYGAVYIYAPDYSGAIIDVSLLGNTIIANAPINSHCVNIRAVGCDSNITFTGNKITQGNGITGSGVALYVYSSNNTNITFVNNNITGTNVAVALDASSSNNVNITFVNNNITGAYDAGVSMSASGVNNTNITFVNNNITAISVGVSLYTYGNNKTNITFVNNNITVTLGVSCGVVLFAYSNNNTNITFDNNNIIGESYGVYVFSYEGSRSCLNFLNNVINSTGGDGFYFFSNYGSVPTDVSDFIIRGNTIFAPNGAGLNFTGLYVGSLVNVTVEYNRILALVGVNITDFNDDSSFDYNWWGVNDISGLIFGIDTNNHYILNITNLTSLDDVKFGDTLGFMFLVLNTTLTNDGVEYLPYFVVNGTYNGQEFVVDNTSNFTGELTIFTIGVQVIDATLDNQDVDFEFYANKANTNSSIIVYNVTFGDNVTIYGQLVNYTGISFINVTVDGVNYTVPVNATGGWNLTYSTNRTGDIPVIVSFAGNGNYNAFTNSTLFGVAKRNIIVLIVVEENDDGSITVIANATYEGDGSPVFGHPVDFILDGEVVGTGITDENGIAKITIPSNKIRDGENTITVLVKGDENSNDGEASTKFIKSSNPKPIDPIDPIDPVEPIDNSDDLANPIKTTDNPTAIAVMKKTGIPIIQAILIIFGLFGIITLRKKRENE